MANFISTLKTEIVHAAWLFAVAFVGQIIAFGTNNIGWQAVVSAVVAAGHVVWVYVEGLRAASKA